jgi:hypothetical protein
MTPALSPADKARRIVAEGRVQILARSERGALALVTNEQGAIYQTTALGTAVLGPGNFLLGTCTCKYGRSRDEPIYNQARGEGCKHYRALLMALEA